MLLRIENLKVNYRKPDGKVWTALDVPLFELDEGEQTVIKGASGSGKTTFLNVIAGLQLPDAGRVCFQGREVNRMGEAERDVFRGRQMAFVFQSFNLLAGFTAMENVLLGAVFAGDPDEETRTTRERAQELLRKAGLGDRLRHRPAMLSAGEQQRVAIARAMMNRPRLILADEPTGSLDEANGREALDLLTKMAADSGAALLLVTHDPSVMGRFKRVVDVREWSPVA
ncbi:MAG: ABC transporter ATP-binding protein [Verrucomicrobiae bacterium]|nr:ABC transporter ATP-binding protein [Verrucomicrobiae bacterium]